MTTGDSGHRWKGRQKSLNTLMNWRTIIRWLTRVSRLHCSGNSMHGSTRVNSCMSAARSWHDTCSNAAFHCILAHVPCFQPKREWTNSHQPLDGVGKLGQNVSDAQKCLSSRTSLKLSSFFVGVSLPVCGLVAFISDSQFLRVRSAVSVTDTHVLKCASSRSIAPKRR